MQKTIRTFLIEDDEIDQKTVCNFLSKEDFFGFKHTVEIASSLKEGMEKVAMNGHEVVLLDLNLPTSSGVETLKKIKTKTNLPIIVMSGAYDQTIPLDAIKYGAQDFLVKGEFSAETLQRSIHYALERGQVSEKSRIIIETAPEAFISINSEGLIVEWNPEAEKTFGWSKDEIIGRSVSETFIPVSLSQDFYKELDHYMKTGDTVIFRKYQELSVFHRNGHEFPIELTVIPLRTKDVIYFNAFIRDISERKKLDRLKDEFISMASHELRTPMAIIQAGIANFTDSLLGTLNEQQMKIARVIDNNAKRLNKIVTNLLDISRLESGQIKPKYSKCSPQNLIKEVIEGLERLAQAKNLSLCCNIESHIPEEILIDEELIIQVLNNLCSNALRFASSQVIIELSQLENYILFSVANDGSSLTEHEIGMLFQKFSQVRRPQGGTGYKGTGLGLAICKEIIKKHNGKIWAESREDDLTRFKFTIPKTQNLSYEI